MMARGKKGSGRQTPKVASEPLRDGGPDEAASFLAEAVADLSKLARRHGMETLGFLLDMAQMEAEEIVRLRERRRSEKS